MAVQGQDGYLLGRGQAWFAFWMTLALMMSDYIDRQIIVSIFPHLKSAWALTDKQLGALASAVSFTVALGGIPIALIADRYSRVKSIVVMASLWSLASISCMFTRNYSQLLTARAVVGVGEAGYGSVGTALLASHFPVRMRGVIMASLFACASLGSVLGVMLGGIISTHWGWQAAFGVVGVPGLILALLYLLVRDYRTVDLAGAQARKNKAAPVSQGRALGALARSRTLLWVCIAAPLQLILVSSVWAWLPSYLNRLYGIAPAQAAVKAALVVLCGALGSVVWGHLADRAARTRLSARLHITAIGCAASAVVLALAFGAGRIGVHLPEAMQFALLAIGGFLMTCLAGVVAAVVMDVTHPSIRATGASVLSLFQNLFGLALGPLIAGALSDRITLPNALMVMPLFGVLACAVFLLAALSYPGEVENMASGADSVKSLDAASGAGDAADAADAGAGAAVAAVTAVAPVTSIGAAASVAALAGAAGSAPVQNTG